MRVGRVVAGGLCALLLASCGGKVKSPGSVAHPANYSPADPSQNPVKPPTTAATPKPTGFGSVAGEVRDVQGRGMGNVKVSVDGSSDVVASTTFNGTFQLTNVPAGWQFITFTYEGQTFAGAVDVSPTQAVQMGAVTFDNRFSAFGNQANGSFELPIKKGLFTWRITNVAAWSGAIYVTAIDDQGLLKDGTVFRLDLRRATKWEEIGDKWLIAKPLSYTASGLSIAGESLFVADTKKGLYKLDPIKGKPKRADKTGYKDVAAGGGKVFFASDITVVGGNSNLEGLSPLSGVTVSGGIGADPAGVLYAVSGNTIVKYNGKAETFARGLNAPIDVAADRQGFVYVLEPGGIKRFDKDGKLLSSVVTHAEAPTGICVDESGAVFVADKASGDKPSRILRFTPAAVATTPAPQPSGWGGMYGGDPYGYGTTPTGTDPYGTAPYGTTPTGTDPYGTDPNSVY